MVDRGAVKESGRGIAIRDTRLLQEELLRGYELAQRPKFLIGRFRFAEGNLDAKLATVREAFRDLSIRWSVTAGPAAYAVQRFYRRIGTTHLHRFFLRSTSLSATNPSG